MNLELLALRWLLYEKGCVLALRERSPRAWSCGQPDALGITRSRYLIEIEIKRSLSDFRADMKKASRISIVRETQIRRLPKLFYYLVPHSMAVRVEPLVPEWAGLMASPGPGEPSPRVIKIAPVNKESKRLSVKECCQLLRMVSNWGMSEAESRHASVTRFIEGEWQWPYPMYEI